MTMRMLAGGLLSPGARIVIAGSEDARGNVPGMKGHDIEKVANELLIPEFLFHKHRREFPTGLDGVKGLAELFQTSLYRDGDSVRDVVYRAHGRRGERGGPDSVTERRGTNVWTPA